MAALQVQVGVPVGDVSAVTVSGLIIGTQQTLALTKDNLTFTDESGNSEEHFGLEDGSEWFCSLSPVTQFHRPESFIRLL